MDDARIILVDARDSNCDSDIVLLFSIGSDFANGRAFVDSVVRELRQNLHVTVDDKLPSGVTRFTHVSGYTESYLVVNLEPTKPNYKKVANVLKKIAQNNNEVEFISQVR